MIDDEDEAAAAVSAAFPLRNTLVLPAELDAEQRALLRAVSQLNTSTDGLFAALNARGLVAHSKSLARYSGATPAGPLDVMCAGAPLWKLFRDAVDEQGAVALQHATAGFEAEQILALCEDAMLNYMSLHLPFPRPSFPDAHQTAVGRATLGRLCAELMAARVPAPLLEQRLLELQSGLKSRQTYLAAALLSAYATAADADDANLARFDGLIEDVVGAGVEPQLRTVLQRLTPEHRAKIVLGLEPDWIRDGSGYVYDGCVPYLDLVATLEAAQIAVEDLTTCEDPPIDRLLEILIAVGAPALPLIESALADQHDAPVASALERARAALEA